jgi:hypothetical protein
MNRRDTVLALLALGAAGGPFAAKALGLKIPQSLLLRADRLIE